MQLHPSWRGNPLLSQFYLYNVLLSSEPSHFVDHFGKSISPEELAEDFHTLRAILQSSPQFGNYLVGPDVTHVSNHSKTASYFERYSFCQFKLIDLIQLFCVYALSYSQYIVSDVISVIQIRERSQTLNKISYLAIKILITIITNLFLMCW